MNDEPHVALGQFTIAMSPSDPLLDSTARFDFTKTWTGAVSGTSTGVMLSGGDPGTGNAGYVALEVFDGQIDAHRGRVIFQQFGTMNAGDYVLRYQIVPGSGTDGLSGITGVLDLLIEEGSHNVTLRYVV